MSGKALAMREEWQREAEGRVVRWCGLRSKDYDFRMWARGGAEGLVRAGIVYENARESWCLRCLLVLVDACLDEVKGMEFLRLSFGGVRFYDALQQLGGWWGWLRRFSEELAGNVSFAELGSEKLKRSLEVLPKYFLSPRAVSLDFGHEDGYEPRVLWPEQLPGEERGGGGKNERAVKLEIRLSDFAPGEIGEAMAELVGKLSGGEKVVERRGKGKRSEINSLLDALSAMRLACWYPRTVPRRSFLCGGASALSRFGDIRLGRIEPGKARRKLSGELSETNFERCAARGRREFERMFPFGERAANALTCAQRRRCKRVV